MALNTTNAVNVNISTTDDIAGAVDINQAVSLSYDSNFAQLIRYQKIPVAVTQLNVTGTTYYQIYIKNNDVTNQLTVNLTPTGGAPVLVTTLNPQDFILIWQKTAGAANAGYTNISVSALVNPALIEYFLGG